MSDQFVAVQCPSGDGYVELARSQKGKLFRKQILPMNQDFVHPNAPGKKIFINQAFAERLQENFRAGGDIVQVPIVNDANQHVEDPLRNAGEVVDLTYDDSGVYATIDARKHAEDFGSTILGASALMHLDYEDTLTGAGRGPTLLHVAATNRPYLNNLSDFEEVVVGLSARSVDTEVPDVLVPVTEPEEEEKMDLEEIKGILKDDHGIDLDALQAATDPSDNSELIAAMSAVLSQAKGGEPKAPETEELTVQDVANAVIEVAEERVALSAEVETLKKTNEQFASEKAEAEVDALIKQGRVLPKQREKMVMLSRTDRETFDALVPDDSIVSLSAEGVDTFDSPEAGEKFQAEVTRLAEIANGK